MILPECWLNETDARVLGICRTMEQYLRDGTLVPAVQQGFILTERITPSGARVGLVGMIDLECYDFHPEAKSLVRASEGTIAERIPPRVRIREKAPLETSHVMLLMDDPMQSVVEPLFQKRRQLRKLYDFPLMMNGGHRRGLCGVGTAASGRRSHAVRRGRRQPQSCHGQGHLGQSQARPDPGGDHDPSRPVRHGGDREYL